MIHKIKIALVSLSALFLLAAPAALSVSSATVLAAADIKGSLCTGTDLEVGDPNKAKCNTDAGGSGEGKLNALITQIINIISVIVAIVAVIMLIFGGFRYVTSGGAADKVKGAKDTILYALIGLVIVALAQTVVKFVVNKLTA